MSLSVNTFTGGKYDGQRISPMTTADIESEVFYSKAPS